MRIGFRLFAALFIIVMAFSTFSKSSSLLPRSLLPLKLRGAILPGDSTCAFAEFELPKLEYGQALLKTKASTICGSDIRCIYKEHLGKGAEGYQKGLIVGHEPAGEIVEVGEGMKQFQVGSRAIVYHVSGCGVCNDCRRGFSNSCTSSKRAAYGWQRNGGMADYLIVEEKDLIELPSKLSYVDGAIVACSFATVYEGLCKLCVSGNDQTLVIGLGPVGISALMLAKKLGSSLVVGVDSSQERVAFAKQFCDATILSSKDADATLKSVLAISDGQAGFEKTIDCSGSAQGRNLGLLATHKWGSMALIGEGGSMQFLPSENLIHDQKTLMGSWVCSTWRMQELVKLMARWDLHPEQMVTHTFSLDNVSEAYKIMGEGKCGKVAVVFD